MTSRPRCPIQFERHRDSSSYTGNHAKEKSQPNRISKTKYDRVRHRSRQHPQWSVFAAQQIVSKVQRAQHIQARPRDAHTRQQVMIDGMHEMHALIVEGKVPTLQKLLPLQSQCHRVSVFFLML
jgi:hypothetical protein